MPASAALTAVPHSANPDFVMEDGEKGGGGADGGGNGRGGEGGGKG